MTATAAAGQSNVTKELMEFVMVAVVAAAAVVAGIASMADADSGVGIASAGGEWVVAAASA